MKCISLHEMLVLSLVRDVASLGRALLHAVTTHSVVFVAAIALESLLCHRRPNQPYHGDRLRFDLS